MARLDIKEVYRRLADALPHASSADKASLALLAEIVSKGQLSFCVTTGDDSGIGLWGISQKNYGPVSADFDSQAATAKSILSERIGDIAAVYDGPVCFYDMLVYSWNFPEAAKRLVKSGTLKVPPEQSKFRAIQEIVTDYPDLFGEEEAELPGLPETTPGETIPVETKPPYAMIAISLAVFLVSLVALAYGLQE